MSHFISNATFEKITNLLKTGQKLLAIRMFVTATNCSILDAKFAIENWERQKLFIDDEKASFEGEKPTPETMDKIYTFLMEGKRPTAIEYIIQVYRLKNEDAEAYLCRLEKGKMPISDSYERKERISDAEIKAKMTVFIKQNQKLQAIKALRSELNFTLTEAIEYTNTLAEEIEEEPPPANEQKKDTFSFSQNIDNEEDTEERIGKIIFWGMIGILMYIIWWMWG